MASVTITDGAVSNWTAALTGSTLNSLASGNALLGDTDIDNSSVGDIFIDFSLVLASGAFVAPNFVGLYLYPLGDDGTHYGDGRFGSAAAGPPSSTYFARNIEIVATTAGQYGQALLVPLPRNIVRPVLWNKGGVNWASSGNTLKYRTRKWSVA